MVTTEAPGGGRAELAGPGHVAGVDLGGTKILAAIISPDGRIIARAKKSTGKKKDQSPATVIDRIAACVREAVTTAGIEPTDLQAIGIGAGIAAGGRMAGDVRRTGSTTRSLPRRHGRRCAGLGGGLCGGLWRA